MKISPGPPSKNSLGLAPIDRVLQRLQGTRRSGRGFTARCPAHDDRIPSLSVAEGRDGRVLLRCWAGCELAAITRALGIDVRDLFASSSPPQRAQPIGRITAAEIERAIQTELDTIVAREAEARG
jgi:hypothetical protein